MTKDEFSDVQAEWEMIEFGNAEDEATFARQVEIENLMDAAPWMLNPDTGEVIPVGSYK